MVAAVVVVEEVVAVGLDRKSRGLDPQVPLLLLLLPLLLLLLSPRRPLARVVVVVAAVEEVVAVVAAAVVVVLVLPLSLPQQRRLPARTARGRQPDSRGPATDGGRHRAACVGATRPTAPACASPSRSRVCNGSKLA